MSEFDFIQNGMAHGSVAQKLRACGGDLGVLRPWGEFTNEGVQTGSFFARNGQTVRCNADAPFTRDAWEEIDRVVEGVHKKALPFCDSLKASGLERVIANGFAKRIVSSQVRSGDAEANLSMDALSQGEGDRPVYDTRYVPLVIAHSDFDLTYRDIETARAGGDPIDTAQVEDATYAVSEKMENLALGNVSTIKFAGVNLYGIKNSPKTITGSTLTAPTASGWTPVTAYEEMSAMVDTLAITNLQRGPFKVYVSRSWNNYLDSDYSTQYKDLTLRERLLKNTMIGSIESIDNLADSTFEMLMIAPEQKNLRLINGMPITTVQWSTDGGFNYKFKVLGIKVPEIRADYNSKSGCLYAVTS